MNICEFSTLRLRRPAAGTPALTVLLLLLIFLLFEGFLRLSFVHDRLTTPRMGSRHSQLGEKLRMLEALVATEGGLDCVALGSSVVDNGFDPQAFSRAYRRVTGQDVTCFNFGIDAIPAATAGALAEILVHDYRPGMIIYGVDARDFAVARDDRVTTVVLDTPWIQYRLGHFNLEGWLFEHSYIQRYSVPLRQLLVFDYENALWKPNEELTTLGYHPLYEVATNVHLPPEPDDDSFLVTVLSDLLANFEVPQENLQGLAQLLNLNSADVRVFVIMMPVADGYYSFYGNGRADYDSFVHQLEELAAPYNASFLSPVPDGSIPEGGWFDYMHVNATGAEAFSEWLGGEVGAVMADKNWSWK